MEIYSLRLPRVWRLMAGFRKLQGMQRGESIVADPERAATAALGALAGIGAAKTVSFDNLPLAAQDWSRRCREAVKHGG